MDTEITIERLGHQGDGVAEGPIFAPRTLPGERVSGILNGTRLSDVRVVTPSDDRVRPPCRHAKACGGCQLQHASTRFVASWKEDIVRTALAAQGLAPAFHTMHTSPPATRRRATFAARRTKKGAMVGFHGPASDVIVENPDCQLVDPAILAGRACVEALAVVGGSRKGALAASITTSRGGLDVTVSGGKPLDGPLRITLAQVADQFGLARLAWEGETVVTRSQPAQSFGAALVVPPPGAFLQATPEGEAALVTGVTQAVGAAARVVDLFSGCGTFALPLAQSSEVHAVESEGDMLEAMDLAWRATQGLKRLSTETRDLYRRPLLIDELARFEAAVLDPPRAGAEAQVAELAKAKLPVIAYVSCNPVTFARDARHLTQAGYQLDWIQVVDQFRWSVHIELVSRFSWPEGAKNPGLR
ncbi:MAG: class I SAM-dependent RNA methyltransferase [Sedimentitalea sp.]